MPSTLPTHPLAVLPLKLWRPRWFDGVALVAGAAAPDTAYLFDRLIDVPRHAVHEWGYSTEHLLGALWWSTPAALLTAWLIRLGAPAVAAHLPGWGREYGVLGRRGHRWWITLLSALIGVASHLLWDLFTHPGPVDDWWLVRQISDYSSLLLMPLFVWYVGRRHLLVRWHGDPPSQKTSPGLFWLTTGLLFTVGALITWRLGYHGPHIVGVRLIAALMLGLLGGAAAVALGGKAVDDLGAGQVRQDRAGQDDLAAAQAAADHH